jgi:hypothetical protein
MRLPMRPLLWCSSFAGVLAIALGASSCGAGDFEAASKVSSVRILGSRADKPYAKPGDTVNLEALSFDGRKDKTRPMKIFWVPLPCVDPPNDLYYLCFAQLLAASAKGDGSDGGAPNPGAALLRPGVDLTPFLPSGPTYAVTLPANIIDAHPPVQGSPDRYGLDVVFNIACAGHVEITAQSADDLRKQQVPLGCFDENHQALGPTEYVIGINRVYAYATRTNANPVIDHVTFQGAPLDFDQGITIDRCDNVTHRVDCPEQKFNAVVTDDSWEVNPGDSPSGDPNAQDSAHEQIWADYYGTIGDFDSDARLLFDTHAGRVSESDVKYYAPKDPGDGEMFIVVHDNRGGAAWVKFPVHVR